MTGSNEQRHTALVTGASSGIGKEFAYLLAGNRHDLVLVATQSQRLEQIAEDLRARYQVNATVIAKDLSQPTASSEIYSELQRQGIRIDVLVNNAGFNVYGPFAETDLDSELKMIHVNLVALTSLTKLFMRDMVARGFGRILNVGSTGSFSPAPFDSVYCATKAYVLSFSEAIAEELRGTGVSVTALCPGPTATEFAERAKMTDTRIFSGRLMKAKEVASIGYRALLRQKPMVITGFANKALVFSMRFSPRTLLAKIAKGLLSRQTPVLTPHSRHT